MKCPYCSTNNISRTNFKFIPNKDKGASCNRIGWHTFDEGYLDVGNSSEKESYCGRCLMDNPNSLYFLTWKFSFRKHRDIYTGWGIVRHPWWVGINVPFCKRMKFYEKIFKYRWYTLFLGIIWKRKTCGQLLFAFLR